MPFEKGKSGNPSGKPKGYHAYRDEMQAELIETGLCMNAVRDILKDKKHPQRAFLARWVVEYCMGKPADRVEHSGPDGKPIEVKSLTDEQLESRLAELFGKGRAVGSSGGEGETNGNGKTH